MFSNVFKNITHLRHKTSIFRIAFRVLTHLHYFPFRRRQKKDESYLDTLKIDYNLSFNKIFKNMIKIILAIKAKAVLSFLA